MANFKEVDSNIKVRSYCPLVFKYIRKLENIKDIDIIKSLDPTNNRF